jgi:helix-turn-helix protein
VLLEFEYRPSESPFVEKVWRSRSDRSGSFLSIAASNFEMAVTQHAGKTFITLRGPETKARMAHCPVDGGWLGIRFTLGTFMPRLAPGQLIDGRDVTLPDATTRSFWLHGSAWDYPDFENAEVFVARLARAGIITRDPAVDSVLRGEPRAQSQRSDQRCFLRATGLSHRDVRQIERARYATHLLKDGTSILDATHEAGYFDQPHLTRSLTRFVGQTPAEITRATKQLSFLYKTAPQP